MNLQQIRDKLAVLKNKTQKKNDLWKPTDEHTVRCLPYPHGDEPFIELGFHYELGAVKSLLCPKFNFGDDCAICDLADSLRSWNDADGNEKPQAVRQADFELFRNIHVKERYFVPVLDRADESLTPKFWSFSPTIYKALLEICVDEENNTITGTEGAGVLTNPKSAFDLSINLQKKKNEDGKGNNKPWPITEVKEKKRPSKLLKSDSDVEELLAKIPDIYTVYTKVSSNEAKKIFTSFVNSGVKRDVIVKDSGTEYSANTAEKPVEGGQSIDEAFDNL